jgi:type IV pilus assembly protein PilV
MSRPCTQQGITLIEVLVAVSLISFALLGMLALQVKAQHAEVDAYQRSQALLIAEDMVNRMYANSDEAESTCYDTSADWGSLPGQWDGDTAPYSGCSDASDRDMAAWNQMLRGTSELISAEDGDIPVGAMLGAVGCIDVDPLDSTLRYVSVAWQGLVALAAPVSACGQGLFESEAKRRVVTMPVRIANWK